MRGQVPPSQQGTGGVAGTRRDVVARPAGRRGTGEALRTRPDWPWRERPPAPGRRDARLTATRPTEGRVTRVRVDHPPADRFDWLGQETVSPAPRLIRAWGRRRWSEPPVRPVKPLVAAEACHVPTADASEGPLGGRVLAGLVRLYTARCRVTGPVTRAEIVCRLTHPWRVLSSAPVACPALSWDLTLEAA